MLWLTWLKRIVSWIFGPILLFLTLGIIGFVALWAYYSAQLPDEQELRNNVSLQLPLKVYSKNKRLIAEFGQYRRRPVKRDEMPQQLVNAFIAIEDARFYEHHGVDFYGIGRAVVTAIKSGNVSQGASTITMQVARNYFLDRRKKLDRKLKEVFLANKLEGIFSKDEIIELYLNKIFLGNRSYGVGSAAEVYYGKNVDQLTLAEMAMIAGLPKAPSEYNPIVNPERAKKRRDYILQRMHELKYINKDEYSLALKEPITAKLHARAQTETEAPYVAEMVRQEVIKRYGEELVYTTGMSVYTTIDDEEQAHAVDTLRVHLIKYHKRHGYKGPEDRIQLSDYADKEALKEKLSSYEIYGGLIPAVVMNVSKLAARLQTNKGEKIELDLKAVEWAGKFISENRKGVKPKEMGDVLAVGDIVRVSRSEEDGAAWELTPLPDISGAIVSMDPVDGAILSAVGGFDFNQTKFNRATQAKRQPGSSFKPFVYSAALEKNYSPASVVNDAPIDIRGSSWNPQNYSGKSYGPTRLREGLKKSRNLVSIQLLREIGVDYARNYVAKFGFIPSEVPNDLTMALGTGSVTPVQLAGAYSTFANGGYKVEPYFITHIADNEGAVIFYHSPLSTCKDCESVQEAQQIMKPHVRYEISSMMRSVAESGTAAKTRVLNRRDIAGKTGTTNDQKDAWFAGFTPRKVAVVWMGFDQIQPMGRAETATGLALPTWIDFMKFALKEIPEEQIVPPQGMVTVNIDALTGFRAVNSSLDVVPETLTPEQVPDYVPADFVYSSGGGIGQFDSTTGLPTAPPKTIIKVNNPVNPTIAMVDKNMIDTIRSTSALHHPVQPNGTRVIVIDNERFEIPEQLF